MLKKQTIGNSHCPLSGRCKRKKERQSKRENEQEENKGKGLKGKEWEFQVNGCSQHELNPNKMQTKSNGLGV